MTPPNEALVILQEECAEVIQVISKMHRFGADNEYNGVSNRERLTQEIADVLVLINHLCDTHVVDEKTIHRAMAKKLKKLKLYSELKL
jgi:NTP pyrophosphatase (non-canonical NTP hydrolase)